MRRAFKRSHTLFHADFDSHLTIVYEERSSNGIACQNGEFFSTSLHQLLNTGWEIVKCPVVEKAEFRKYWEAVHGEFAQQDG